MVCPNSFQVAQRSWRQVPFGPGAGRPDRSVGLLALHLVAYAAYHTRPEIPPHVSTHVRGSAQPLPKPMNPVAYAAYRMRPEIPRHVSTHVRGSAQPLPKPINQVAYAAYRMRPEIPPHVCTHVRGSAQPLSKPVSQYLLQVADPAYLACCIAA